MTSKTLMSTAAAFALAIASSAGFAAEPAAPTTAPATKPTTVPALPEAKVPDNLTGAELALRAQQAYNRGEYAVALPLYRKMAAESENLPAKLASIQERIRVSEKAVAAARAEAARRGLANVRFEARDVAAMGEEAAFDLVTAFDAIHDQARPDAVLRNIARALRPGGTFLMQDIAGSSHVHTDMANPLAPFLYSISCMHCMSVSLANGGPGLGAAWGKEVALRMLREAGFEQVRVETLPHDFLNYYYIATPKP